MPVIVPIFDNIEIVQGSISDDDVKQSINRCHPLTKIWFSTIKNQSAATDNIQLQSSSITVNLSNIKRSGILTQHMSFETSAKCASGKTSMTSSSNYQQSNGKTRKTFSTNFLSSTPLSSKILCYLVNSLLKN